MNDVMTDKIIIRSVFGKVIEKYIIQPTRDPKTQRFPSHVRPVNVSGEMMLSEAEKNSNEIYIAENRTFIITDGTTFDLNDPWEKAEWLAIQHCPLIAMSRDARDKNGNLVIDGNSKRYGSAELYVERPGVEVVKKISKKKLINKAENYIFNDEKGIEGRYTKARLLGKKGMKNAPDADVEDFLLQIAAKNPEKIVAIYEDNDIGYRILFMDARDKHIITVKNKLYVYGESFLGATEEAAILYLMDKKNVKLLELLKKETYPEFSKD